MIADIFEKKYPLSKNDSGYFLQSMVYCHTG
jgi:formylmethanofuran dehydrogenase subunit E-like metal-binding protein